VIPIMTAGLLGVQDAARRASGGAASVPGTSVLPSAAVVIRARNEARFIGQTLAAIVQPAALQPRNVVVVDSGSTDGTLNIVRCFPISLIQIRPEEFTYGYALNLAAAETDADIVVSLSAHSTPAGSDWLRSLLEPFADPRVAGVYGRQLPRANATPLDWLGMWLSGVLGDRPKLLDRRPLFSNANGAFRRALWLAYPFDEQVAGAEDIAWARRLQQHGYLIAYQPTAAVYHSHGEPLITHLRRASRDVPTVMGNLLHLGSGEPADDQRGGSSASWRNSRWRRIS